jgi:hypothetical protein
MKMIKLFKRRKKVSEKDALRAEMLELKRSGMDTAAARAKEYAEKYGSSLGESVTNWYNYLTEEQRARYEEIAEKWYKMTFTNKPVMNGQDISYTGITKDTLTALEDLRGRMFEILYHDKWQDQYWKKRVPGDTHCEIEFDDDKPLSGTVTVYKNPAAPQTHRFESIDELDRIRGTWSS